MSNFYCRGCGSEMTQRRLKQTREYDSGNGSPTYITWYRYSCPKYKGWQILWTKHDWIITKTYGATHE